MTGIGEAIDAPRTNPDILIVEDTSALARVYQAYLETDGRASRIVATGAEAMRVIERTLPAVVLLDLKLPDMEGMEVLRWVAERALPVAVIVVTAHGSVAVAVDAMRGGAYDFLLKPFSAERLTVTVRNALERQVLAARVDTLAGTARASYHGFIGSSPAMQAVYRIIDAAASSRATVFITGESGTGKELCAEAIHAASPRRAKPFVALNCAAIPRELMESEIFGHVRGAFTGATSDRPGAALQADGGTLFLDEVCEMAPELQTKLLRFLQTGTVQPVGSTESRPVDLRFVCATNRNPLEEVAAGRFREDLFYRLHVIPLTLPPLRERAGDVLEIARALLADYAAEEGKPFESFAPDVEATLAAYGWPGNVRQLQNVIRNIVVLHGGPAVTRGMLPPPLDRAGPEPDEAAAPAPAQPTSAGPVTISPLWQTEREAIEFAIAACNGNIPRAAAALQVSPSTLYRKKLAWQAEEAGGI